jgi:hypothetical protein
VKVGKKEMRSLIREALMIDTRGAPSPMMSRADPEFAKIIRQSKINESAYKNLDLDTQLEIASLIEDNLDAIDILKALVYDVYSEDGELISDMLEKFGYTPEQVSTMVAEMGSKRNILASEFIDMSDLESEDFLADWLHHLSSPDVPGSPSEDLGAISKARYHAEESYDSLPIELEQIRDYLNSYGYQQGDDYEFSGDGETEPYHIKCETIEIGDGIHRALDPEGSGYNSDNPLALHGQNVDVNHHRMNVTWEFTSPTLREITRNFIKAIY